MKKNNWILLLFILSIAIFTLSFYFVEPDYLWHIKAGEYMLHHGILTKDVFSWSVYGKYWMSHEWLFEVIIYSLKQVFGHLHLFIYCLLGIGGLLYTIYRGNKEHLFKNILFTIFWFSCSLILCCFIQGRPHIISNILLSLTMYFLYDLYKNEDSKKVYFLPIISILWSNIHGGSSNLPYLLCLLFIVFGSFKFSFTKIEAKRLSKLQYKKYILIMILCMIGVCINIHGFKMFIYPYQNMLDTTMLNNITEWRNTSLSELSHYAYFALLLVIVGIFLLSKKKIEFVDFIIFGFCTYLGLKSIRFWSYTYIMMSYIVFYYIGKRKEDKGTYTGLLIISIVLIGLFLGRSNTIINPKYEYLLSSKDINIIRESNPERLFNMYNYGGDLVYQSIPVFIDGRADLYGRYNYKDYLAISNTEGEFEKIIDKYNFDYYLIDKNYPIYYYLKNNNNYELIYKNKDIYYYKKKN